MTHTLTCNGCGKEFTARRADARFCSPRCRTASHRKAKEGKKGPRWPLPSSVSRRTLELQLMARSLRSLLDDDRWKKYAKTEDAVIRRAQLEGVAADIARVLDAIPNDSDGSR